ncbi:hypothetical protein LINGRAHAP2_LOCUS7889 [Linum grandiflorum]
MEARDRFMAEYQEEQIHRDKIEQCYWHSRVSTEQCHHSSHHHNLAPANDQG